MVFMVYIYIYNISPPFKDIINKQKLYKRCVIFICNYKKYLKRKYVINETYNIIYRNFKT